MWPYRQLEDLSLLTERKTLKVRRTINMSLLRSEETVAARILLEKQEVAHLLHREGPQVSSRYLRVEDQQGCSMVSEGLR